MNLETTQAEKQRDTAIGGHIKKSNGKSLPPMYVRDRERNREKGMGKIFEHSGKAWWGTKNESRELASSRLASCAGQMVV